MGSRDEAIDAAVHSLSPRSRRRGGNYSGVSGLRAHLNALAKADPEAIRTEVIAQGRDPFIAGIVDALSERGGWCSSCERASLNRWAFRLYAELAKLVGSAPEIALTVINAVGAPVTRARTGVAVLERAETMAGDEDAMIAAYERELSTLYAKRGWTVPQWQIRNAAELPEAREGPALDRAWQNGDSNGVGVENGHNDHS